MTALAPFVLHRPTSIAEASGLLRELGDDGVAYAGGTELLLLLKLGLAAYGNLVDVKPIAELGRLEVTSAGTLRIGAGVTHRTLERSPIVAAGWPALREMERQVANIRVRSMGSLGGNLAFADPHSDPGTFLLAADARIELGLGESRRSLPIDEFILGPYETALRPHELVVAVEVPPVPEGAAMTHVRFAFRERPAVTVSCLARVEAGRVADARVAIGSVGMRPVRAAQAEATLLGVAAADPDPAALDAAGRAAAEAADPIADGNGSAAYKWDLVRVLVGRAFTEALRRTAA